MRKMHLTEIKIVNILNLSHILQYQHDFYLWSFVNISQFVLFLEVHYSHVLLFPNRHNEFLALFFQHLSFSKLILFTLMLLT